MLASWGFVQLAEIEWCLNSKQMQASAAMLLFEKQTQVAALVAFFDWFQLSCTEVALWNGQTIHNAKHVFDEVFEVLRQIYLPLFAAAKASCNHSASDMSLLSIGFCVFMLIGSVVWFTSAAVQFLFFYCCDFFPSVRWISYSGSSTEQWVSSLLNWFLLL